ncbi:MAG TPA: hypothetical protein ENG70_05165, partial [Candidatus Cloacimonetes bacterium]|nr:hypothetical protein [Candidatus Cloacimonadota bacterium]HEX38228.1 hypothetical protein [Candidatus Cloacimonadota bacterium]
MKKITTLLIVLLLIAASLHSFDVMRPSGKEPQAVQNYDISKMKMYTGMRDNYPIPDYDFIVDPNTIMTSYYDYMPGSYCSYPIDYQTENGSGTYIGFFGRASTTANRRQYYAYYGDASTTPDAWGTISTYDYWQGYGSIVIHPASGNCFTTWHEDFDTDPKLPFTYDDYALLNIPGFWSTPIVFYNTPPDQYCWPYLYMGSSPIGDDYLRIYYLSNNAANTASGYPCEDVRLLYTDIENTLYADFSAVMNTANWNETTIFTSWRDKDCRPFQAFAVDHTTPGRVAFIGCAAWLSGDLGDMPVDEGAFVWESYDYGETWSTDNLHSDGPTDYFYTVANLPQFTNNSGDILPNLEVGAIAYHSTATYDAGGNLHFPYMQSYGYTEAGTSYYFNHFLPQAELVWNGSDFEYRNVPAFPWMDTGGSGHDVPWGVVGEDTMYVYSVGFSKYPGDSNIFHENAQKQAINLENNWMLQLWADGTYVQLAEDDDPAYQAYAEHPILYLSASIDNGENWSDPIKLTDIYNPKFDFSEQITVYPYINHFIKDLGDNWGEVTLFYLDDNSFGSYIQGQGEFNGGQITQCKIQVDFNLVSTDEPVVNVITMNNFPNPFTASTRISFNSKQGFDQHSEVSIYNTKGQLVRTLDLTLESPHRGYSEWNGKDSSGRRVANGI